MSYHRGNGLGLSMQFEPSMAAQAVQENPLKDFSMTIAQKIVHEPEVPYMEPTVLPSGPIPDPLATFQMQYESVIPDPRAAAISELQDFSMQLQYPVWNIGTGAPIGEPGVDTPPSAQHAYDPHVPGSQEFFNPGMNLPGAPGVAPGGMPSAPSRPCQTPAGPMPSYPNRSAFGTACISSGGQISPQGICTLKSGAKMMLGPGGCPTFVAGTGPAPTAKAGAGVGTMAIVGAGLAALLLLR